jgi:D-aminopeptidase
MRARELGINIGRLEPGPMNAITDVEGVAVGHCSVVEGDDVRTGVTVVVPPLPVFAAPHCLNGNGEMTGLEWVRESGELTTPIAITNTHSVGVVRDAIVEWAVSQPDARDWSLPVVGETYDGFLNDINGFHVRPEHVFAALDSTSDGPVGEGAVGGGTGMVCHGFKGGIGTASRELAAEAGRYTVGVLVQANHGRRERLTIDGVAVGRAISADEVPEPELPGAPDGRRGGGSIVVIVATDAPLLPHQCAWLAQRAGLGVGRVGGAGEHWSGDVFVAFATGNRDLPSGDYGAAAASTVPLRMLTGAHLNPLYDAAIEATEEAIVNALLAAQTMTGRDGIVAHALDPDRLAAAL